jgi:hypothetical protein
MRADGQGAERHFMVERDGENSKGGEIRKLTLEGSERLTGNGFAEVQKRMIPDFRDVDAMLTALGGGPRNANLKVST